VRLFGLAGETVLVWLFVLLAIVLLSFSVVGQFVLRVLLFLVVIGWLGLLSGETLIRALFGT
jgi:hypothetical protein